MWFSQKSKFFILILILIPIKKSQFLENYKTEDKEVRKVTAKIDPVRLSEYSGYDACLKCTAWPVQIMFGIQMVFVWMLPPCHFFLYSSNTIVTLTEDIVNWRINKLFLPHNLYFWCYVLLSSLVPICPTRQKQYYHRIRFGLKFKCSFKKWTFMSRTCVHNLNQSFMWIQDKSVFRSPLFLCLPLNPGLPHFHCFWVGLLWQLVSHLSPRRRSSQFQPKQNYSMINKLWNEILLNIEKN